MRRGHDPRLFLLAPLHPEHPSFEQPRRRQRSGAASLLMPFFPCAMKKQSEVRLGQAPTKRKSRKLPECIYKKRQGELAELAFMFKAASLGLGVAKPYGETERFDFIVSSGRRLWRVQVKSTSRACHRHYAIHAHGSRRPNVDLYTKAEIDVIVAYLIPEDAWYVVPIGAIRGRRSLYFYPNGSERGLAKFEKYREAWWQMKSNRKSGVAKRSGTSAGRKKYIDPSHCPG
jgi:PD-(D/E)XK endonuclease